MLRSVAFAAALLTTFASTAFADKITISGHTNYRQGVGGEFNVRPFDDASSALAELSTGYVGLFTDVAGTADGTRMKANNGVNTLIGFQTFCIEYNEHISLPGNYEAAISYGSIYGGVAGGIDHDSNAVTPTTDFISVGTAYLYSQFAKGSLAGYQYTNGSGPNSRAASAETLQMAIWWLEDEINNTTHPSFNPLLNPFLQLAFGAHGTPIGGVGDAAGGAKANNTLYNVRALNLGGLSPTQQQDQLIMVPDGGVTFMLLSLGLSGLALLRRQSN